jgi:hypothetical protein
MAGYCAGELPVPCTRRLSVVCVRPFSNGRPPSEAPGTGNNRFGDPAYILEV